MLATLVVLAPKILRIVIIVTICVSDGQSSC